MIRVDKESVKNSQQHLGNDSNVILRNKYQPCFEATFSEALKDRYYIVYDVNFISKIFCVIYFTVYNLQSSFSLQS